MSEPTWREKIAAQTAALDAMGFDPAFSVGGGSVLAGSSDFATCRTCGAVCQILGGVTDAEQPANRHAAWHAEVER